jgi:hypothetical protein
VSEEGTENNAEELLGSCHVIVARTEKMKWIRFIK